MTATFLYANNAKSTLAGAISNTATTALLASGTGVLFPNPSAGQQFALTFVDAATGLLNEIVYVTARSGDTITMIRGQEGTTALNWSSGDLASSLLTAGNMDACAQETPVTGQIQAQAGNYAVATGTADTYAFSLTPALTARQVGVPYRIKFPAGNTGGAATINDGLGAVALTRPGGQGLFIGDIGTSYYVNVMWDGTRYVLNDLLSLSLVQEGVIASGVVVPNDGTFYKICDLNRASSKAALMSINAGYAPASAAYCAMILAIQFGAGITPTNVVTENTPGTVAFRVVNQDVQMSVTGGSGPLTVSITQLLSV